MKNLVTYILVFLSSIRPALCQNFADSLNNRITAIFNSSELPGLSLTIVDTSGVLFSKGYGYANKEEKIPYTEYTTQRIASISKTFISIALMKSIEEGHFTLETPINELLPFEVKNPHYPNEEIKIKHLATHTSGISDGEAYWRNVYFLLETPKFESKSYTDAERYFFKTILPNQRIDESAFLKNYLSTKGKWYNMDNFIKSKPGLKYEYCNTSAALAAYIVEIVQGIPYSKYIEQEIFEPLEMTSTNWEFEPPLDSLNEAIMYLNNGDRCPLYSFSTYSDGAIRSSSADLVKYLLELIGGANGSGQLLKSDSYKLMFSSIVEIDESDAMGIFWFTQKRLNDRFHQGSGAGITTVLSFNPVDQLGCMILCNHETDNKKQSDAYVAIWKELIKYRKLLTKDE